MSEEKSRIEQLVGEDIEDFILLTKPIIEQIEVTEKDSEVTQTILEELEKFSEETREDLMIVGYLAMVEQLKHTMDAVESKNLYPDGS